MYQNKIMKFLLTISICISVTASAQSWKDLKDISKKAKSELKKVKKPRFLLPKKRPHRRLKMRLILA